jgi:hypothetical protein
MPEVVISGQKLRGLNLSDKRIIIKSGEIVDSTFQRSVLVYTDEGPLYMKNVEYGGCIIEYAPVGPPTEQLRREATAQLIIFSDLVKAIGESHK